MLRHVAALLLLSAVCSAAYPKATVIFADPADHFSEAKCCMGVFNQPHFYNGRYQVNAIYVGSHVRDYVTDEVGPAVESINVTISKGSGDTYTNVVTARFEGEANPTELIRVPISYVTEPDLVYFVEMWYGNSLTYPSFLTVDTSIGPIASTPGPFYMLGIEYENAE